MCIRDREYGVEAIFGMHLWPDLPSGVIASRRNEMMSRSCEVTVEITGRLSLIHISSAVAANRSRMSLNRPVYVAGFDRGVRPMGLWSMAMTLSRCSMPSKWSCRPARSRARFSLDVYKRQPAEIAAAFPQAKTREEAQTAILDALALPQRRAQAEAQARQADAALQLLQLLPTQPRDDAMQALDADVYKRQAKSWARPSCAIGHAAACGRSTGSIPDGSARGTI